MNEGKPVKQVREYEVDYNPTKERWFVVLWGDVRTNGKIISKYAAIKLWRLKLRVDWVC